MSQKTSACAKRACKRREDRLHIPAGIKTLPLLRVYSAIDSISGIFAGIDMEYLEGWESFPYTETICSKLVRPAEEEMLSFLTEREITIKDLQQRKFPTRDFMEESFTDLFPVACASQHSLRGMLAYLGADASEHEMRKSDFHTLMVLCASFGNISEQQMKAFSENRLLWKPYFRSHLIVISIFPMLRAIESLRENLTMEEWGKRRKIFFGKSLDELENGGWDDLNAEEADESNTPPWEE